jgi:hypothetical protein
MARQSRERHRCPRLDRAGHRHVIHCLDPEPLALDPALEAENGSDPHSRGQAALPADAGIPGVRPYGDLEQGLGLDLGDDRFPCSAGR